MRIECILYKCKGPSYIRKDTVQHFFTIILFFLPLFSLNAAELLDFQHMPFTNSQKRKIADGHHIVISEVTTLAKNQQEFKFKVGALHPKSCRIALRKLSRYETFERYLDFVAKSSYNEKTGRVYFLLKSPLLPYNMVLNFKLERISKPGIYHFSFDTGFLRGLKGEIHISSYQQRCLFVAHTYWKGPDTHIPDLVFEFFTQALSKTLVNRLFSISRF